MKTSPTASLKARPRAVLNAGLILALALFTSCRQTTTGPNSGANTGTATPSPTADAKFQEITLEGIEKEEVATTAGEAGLAAPERLVGKFSEFSLPQDAFPQLMTTAPDGSIYYAQGKANKIGQVPAPTAEGGRLRVRDFAVPTAGSFPQAVAVGPDGNVWFTEKTGSQIGKLDPKTGQITEYKTPTPNSGPVGITIGPDNAIWFTEGDANKIGRLDPNNPDKIEEFSIATPRSAPIYIVTGPDRALWFVEVLGHKLGRIDAGTREITEYPTKTPKSGPTSLVVGSDGAIWVAEHNVDMIARFDVNTKTFTDEVPIRTRKNGPRSGPGILVNGPDGNIWFTEMYGNQIGRLNPKTRAIHEFTAPSSTKLAAAAAPAVGDSATAAWRDVEVSSAGALAPTGGPGGIVFSRDGTVWYTAMFTNKLARLQTGR
jgi:virginiamycin B lyase